MFVTRTDLLKNRKYRNKGRNVVTDEVKIWKSRKRRRKNLREKTKIREKREGKVKRRA